MYLKILLLLGGVTFLGFNKSAAQSKVEAQVSNFSNSKGICRACLFNTPASFNGKEGKPVQCVEVPVKDKKATITFNNIPSGTYAVSVFHDVNSNNKLDVNFLGIPKEGYGASKNKLPFASAPTFNENRFVVNANATTNLSIRLRNL